MARRPRPPEEGAQPKGSGGVAAPTLDDERHSSTGFLSQRTLRLSDRAGPFPERDGDPGTGPGVEADAEVALILDDWLGSTNEDELGGLAPA